MTQETSSLVAATADAGALQTRETSGDVLAAGAKALVEARYVIALRNPRDLDKVRERLLKECRRPGFAAVARYEKPVGGKKIPGPSIRFAEAALRCMTNITVDVVTVYDDPEKRIVRVIVSDLESNVPLSQDVAIQKTVERRFVKEGDVVLRQRINSQGERVNLIEATEDDFQNKQNAQVSKVMRNLILRVVPGDIVDECMGLVIETQRKKDKEDPDGARKALLDAFGSVGVTVEQVKEYLGHDGATLQPKELEDLRGIFTAIRDGEATWRDVMDGRGGAEPEKPKEDLTERVRQKAADDKAPPADTKAPDPAPATSSRRRRF